MRSTTRGRATAPWSGGRAHCLQNPSDTDAGYSGHKGPGHQVQIAQALPPRDADGKIEGPGLLTACEPQERALKERLAARREEQQTAEWKRPYAARSGIEGVHRALDAVTGINLKT